jgi:D-alanine-D-alanine ligase
MEVVFVDPGVKHPVYHYQLKQDFTEHTRFSCPADLSAREIAALETTARRAFDALGCLDVARIDFRLAQDGTPYVIEVNPLPGLSPGFSDLCLIAEGAQMSYAALIGEILKGPLQRTNRTD